MALAIPHDQTVTWPFLVGVIARRLQEPNEHNHIFEWILYLKPFFDGDCLALIDKVEFELHPTYQNPKRVVDDAPYMLKETGFAGFNAVIRPKLNCVAKGKIRVFTQPINLDGAPILTREQLADESKWLRNEQVVQIDLQNPTQLVLHLIKDNMTVFKAGHFEEFKAKGKLKDARKGINEIVEEKNALQNINFQAEKRTDSEDVAQVKKNRDVLINLPIVLGLKARRLRFATKKGHIYEWIFFMEPLYDEDFSSLIREVTMELHPSFPKPYRSFIAPPYRVMETAYAQSFEIKVLIRMQDRYQKQSQIVYTVQMGDAPIISEEEAEDEAKWLNRKKVTQILLKNPSIRLRSILSSFTGFKPGHFELYEANGKLQEAIKGEVNQFKM